MEGILINDKNLTDFLLTGLRKAPALYLKDAKLTNLSIFISGYYCANPNDDYFGKNGFLTWMVKYYDIRQSSNWEFFFLKIGGGDEIVALKIYFEYLEIYSKTERG